MKLFLSKERMMNDPVKSDKKEHHVFSQEHQILLHCKETYQQENIDTAELKNEYIKLTHHYDELLNQTKIITRVSDRLQNKFNNANAQLEQKNIELQQTIDELTKAKVGRKATTIVLIIAVILFILSEGVFEPLVEKYSSNFLFGFAFKGLIALLLKPIESLVESTLLKRAFSKNKIIQPIVNKI